MLDTHRQWFKGIEILTAKIFAVLPLTPNQYTSLAIILALICGYFLIAGNYWMALGFFILAGYMDFIDGAVARAKNLVSPRGAYWDTIADRYVEAILLFSLLFVDAPILYLPGYAWIFIALVGTMMTTYAKAAAAEKKPVDFELKGGILSRAERWIIYAGIMISLIFLDEAAPYLLILLAILANITALQRIIKALRNQQH